LRMVAYVRRQEWVVYRGSSTQGAPDP
jgi:hypothetical protein